MRSRDRQVIASAIRLDRGDRARAARALAWLVAATVAVRIVPFATLTRLIARIPASRSRRAAITPAECGAAIRRAARVWPIARCLPQAIAGYCLLRRAGRTPTLTLGARVDGTRLDAHAWLDCDDVRITGSDVAGRYAPLTQARRT